MSRLRHLLPAALVTMLGLLAATTLHAQKFYQCEEGETAQVHVWAAESLEEADLCVFFVYDASELGKEGVVMQVPTVQEADFSLTFVDDKAQSEFSLWIVETPEQAGWRNKEKEGALSKFKKK